MRCAARRGLDVFADTVKCRLLTNGGSRLRGLAVRPCLMLGAAQCVRRCGHEFSRLIVAPTVLLNSLERAS